MSRILFAAAVGSVFYFLFGWVVFEGLLGGYMAGHTTQLAGFKKVGDEASMGLIFLSCAAYALLVALVVGRWARAATFLDGLAIGTTVGALVAVMTDSYWFATSHFFDGPAPLVADVAAAALTVGGMGGVVGWALGFYEKRFAK